MGLVVTGTVDSVTVAEVKCEQGEFSKTSQS